MIQLQTRYKHQLQEGVISQKTFNWRIRGTEIINEINNTGCFEWKVFNRRNPKEKISDYYDDVLAGFLGTLTCSSKRKSIYKSIIRRFFLFLLKHGHEELYCTDASVLRNFIIDISTEKPRSMDDVITALRKLFEYLNDNSYIDNQCYTILAAPRSRDRKVYPCMSADELASMMNGIDRNTSTGKRDYAVLMLTATTGLRAGDLASLKLTDIDWCKNEIHLVQGKTHETLILPMHNSAGNALAHYILNARPASDAKNIFIRNCAPYTGLHDGVSIACIFRKHLKLSGITHETGDGRTMHGIRRMIGTEMTAEGIPITTVSQVLGHKDIGATKQYISLNVAGLKQCTLGFDSIGGVSR